MSNRPHIGHIGRIVAATEGVTNVFSREKLSPVNFTLATVVATTGVTYFFLPVNPPPWKTPRPGNFSVVTLCALLTRDLFAIAKFVLPGVVTENGYLKSRDLRTISRFILETIQDRP